MFVGYVRMPKLPWDYHISNENEIRNIERMIGSNVQLSFSFKSIENLNFPFFISSHIYSITHFFISNAFFGLGSNFTLRSSNFLQIGHTLPEKKPVRKSAIIWKRSWGLVLNIFRDLCFRIGQYQANVAYESVWKTAINRYPPGGDFVLIKKECN